MVRVIKAIHGDDEKIGKNSKSVYPSIWLDIVHELELIKKQGIDVINCIHKKLGNRANTVFWDDVWRGDVAFKHISTLWVRVIKAIHGDDEKIGKNSKSVYPSIWLDIVHELELIKKQVFRRVPSRGGRGGVENNIVAALLAKVEGVSLVNMKDRFNISRRGMDIESILCPICEDAVESTRHIFFTCRVAKEILRKISCWWEITYSEVSSYEEWIQIESVMIPGRIFVLLEVNPLLLLVLDVILIVGDTVSINSSEIVLSKDKSFLEDSRFVIYGVGIGTDNAKISRKRLKPDKHEHGNGRAHKELGECYQKSTQINL
ncbi:RNA-directed DNA polymerase, eukaryota, reverse transcriptase zinc-binding domain protein [Tanacetum coccineum]